VENQNIDYTKTKNKAIVVVMATCVSLLIGAAGFIALVVCAWTMNKIIAIAGAVLTIGGFNIYKNLIRVADSAVSDLSKMNIARFNDVLAEYNKDIIAEYNKNFNSGN